ncbi:MAG TPA: hypothetical protein VFN96_05210, partial [Gemmatimonadales bacterium]|nr:hypothetical protein [Gemmatimonadales bacterium]
SDDRPGSAAGPEPISIPFGSLTLAAIAPVWPELVAAVRERSVLTGEALAAVTPTAFEAGGLTLTAPAEQDLLVQGLTRQRQLVEETLAGKLGGPVRVNLTMATPEVAPVQRHKRMTDSDLRAEKLARIRKLDPALDIAADALDLEIVDEGPRSS